MIWKIATRNLFRNKRRSMIIISSIAVATFAIVIMSSFAAGMISQFLANKMNFETSHIQINSKSFRSDPKISKTITNKEDIFQVLDNRVGIEAYSARVIAFGLLTTSKGSAGISLTGIDHTKEKEISKFHEVIKDGTYLSGKKREILISKDIAKKLDTEIGDRIVCIINTRDGSVVNELFKVSGIYESGSSMFDRLHAYINLNAAQNLLDIGEDIHQIAIMNSKYQIASAVDSELESVLSDKYEILSYRELLPLVVSYLDSYKQSIAIFYAIIGFAAFFGIVNTMLMSVFERIQEFGVLMSIGMKKKGIFQMVMAEAFMLGLSGLVFGFAITAPVYLIVDYTGVNLSAFSDGLSTFGISSMLYPELEIDTLIGATLAMMISAILGAIYPALKAMRLQPTDAMRYV